MKKIILSVALIFSVVYLNAQNDGVIQLYIAQKNYDKAKEEVDKWLAEPKLKDKDRATANLWKLVIYGQIYKDSALSKKYPGADAGAMSAFYAYQQTNPDLKQLRADHFEVGLSDVDLGYINRGNVFWGNKKYDSAFRYFSAAERTREIIYSNKLAQANPSFDTTLVLYIGIAAQEATQYDSAAIYYGKIADAKIGGADNANIYKFLVQYNYNRKNDADFKKYLAVSKELYPNENELWTQYEMSNMTANTNINDLIQKYQQESAGGSLTEDKLVAYAEAFAAPDSAQVASLDSTQQLNVKLVAAQAFAKAFELNNKNGLYAFNVGVIYYGIYNTLEDRYMVNRGEGAALKAKREQIAKQEVAYADTAAVWLEKAYPVLKEKQDRLKLETASLSRTVDYLANIYYWKRDQTKINGNSKDYDKYDALYKKYDAEHGMYR